MKDRPQSIKEIPLDLRTQLLIESVPGFAEATTAFLAGVTDYRRHCERRLAKLVLGRDPITTQDVTYSHGRIVEIGGQRVEGYTLSLMPERVGGRQVVYGILSTPLSLRSP